VLTTLQMLNLGVLSLKRVLAQHSRYFGPKRLHFGKGFNGLLTRAHLEQIKESLEEVFLRRAYFSQVAQGACVLINCLAQKQFVLALLISIHLRFALFTVELVLQASLLRD